MEATKILLIISTLLATCSAGSQYFNDQSGQVKLLVLGISKETLNTFFKGDRLISSDLIQSENGKDQCISACHDNPECNSINVGETRPGEWICQLTKYNPEDTDYIREPQEPGFNNYAIKRQ